MQCRSKLYEEGSCAKFAFLKFQSHKDWMNSFEKQAASKIKAASEKKDDVRGFFYLKYIKKCIWSSQNFKTLTLFGYHCIVCIWLNFYVSTTLIFTECQIKRTWRQQEIITEPTCRNTEKSFRSKVQEIDILYLIKHIQNGLILQELLCCFRVPNWKPEWKI